MKDWWQLDPLFGSFDRRFYLVYGVMLLAGGLVVDLATPYSSWAIPMMTLGGAYVAFHLATRALIRRRAKHPRRSVGDYPM